MATITGLSSNLKSSRTGIVVKNAVGIKKSVNRRMDVESMAEKVNQLKSNLKLLITVLKAEHAAMLRLNEARLEVAKVLAGLAANSPIEKCCGNFPSEGEATGHSFASIRSSHVVKSKLMCERYAQFILNYAMEWERAINTRTSADIKKNEQLRRELDHYETKVESLRQSVNITIAKNKVVNPKVTEQLNRNETKLTESRLQYDKFSTNLTAMLDELTASCWKDLHPLMIKLSQFDITTANDQSTCFSQLKDVLETLKGVAAKNGLKPEDRLKDIVSQDIETLGAPSLRYAIENGSSGSNPYMGGGMGGGSQHSSNLLDHDPLSSDMGSLAIDNDPYAPSSDFISSYNSSQNQAADDFTSSITDYSAPITSAPSNDLLNMNDPPSTVPPPYAPPPNPPMSHSIFDMPSSEPAPAYRRESSSSVQPLTNSLSVFDSAGPSRRDSSTSHNAYPYPPQQSQRDSFTSPAPSYNSWQNQPSQPSWQHNQPSKPSSAPSWQNQPGSAPNSQSSYQNQPPNHSWQNQSNSNSLTVSSKQPQNQWSSSMTGPSSYQPPPTQQKPYNQQYSQGPPPGPPPGQWNRPMGAAMGPPPSNMSGPMNNMAPHMPAMPPGPPPPSMSQIPSYNRQNSGNPF